MSQNCGVASPGSCLVTCLVVPARPESKVRSTACLNRLRCLTKPGRETVPFLLHLDRSSDSDAYLPLVKAAAAQRAKAGAASRGNGAANGDAAAATRRAADAEDTAASSVASGSGAQRTPDDAPDPAGAAVEYGPRRRVGQHEARSGGPRTSREPHQRHSAAAGGAAQWRAFASERRVASAAAPEAGGTVAQQPGGVASFKNMDSLLLLRCSCHTYPSAKALKFAMMSSACRMGCCLKNRPARRVAIKLSVPCCNVSGIRRHAQYRTEASIVGDFQDLGTTLITLSALLQIWTQSD